MKLQLAILFILINIITRVSLGIQHHKLLNYDSPDKIKNKYLITLKDISYGQTNTLPVISKLRSKSGVEVNHMPPTSDLSKHGLHIIPVYISSDVTLLEILRMPEVAYVEADFRIKPSCVNQTSASWGLNRISGRQQASSIYQYEGGGGNVTIYVVDSGVLITHQDFGGRAVFGTCVTSSVNPQADILNHGTGVASCAAGTTLGTAKDATIVSVRVFDDFGLSTLTDNVLGIAYAFNHHYNESVRLNPGLTQTSQHTVAGAPPNFVRPRSIINMSFGSLLSSVALDSILEKVDEYGMISVAAAGNDGHDACKNHPGSSSYVITVGCTNSSNHLCDDSNYGECVDFLAPGRNVAVALGTGNTITGTNSGTSFSAPYVAGVIANYVSTLSDMPTPSKVRDWLTNTSTKNQITLNQTATETCTPNKLVFMGCGASLWSHSYPNASYENPSCIPVTAEPLTDDTNIYIITGTVGSATVVTVIAVIIIIYKKKRRPSNNVGNLPPGNNEIRRLSSVALRQENKTGRVEHEAFGH